MESSRLWLLERLTLTVGAGHFSTVRDVPWTVPFNGRCELVVHASILALRSHREGCKECRRPEPEVPQR